MKLRTVFFILLGLLLLIIVSFDKENVDVTKENKVTGMPYILEVDKITHKKEIYEWGLYLEMIDLLKSIDQRLERLEYSRGLPPLESKGEEKLQENEIIPES